MELRYLGFEQQENARAYRFDVIEKGVRPLRCTVTADMALFRTHHVAIQEGPTLCAGKLAADIEKHQVGGHELTGADLQSYADARTAAEAHRAEMRRNPKRRPAPAVQPESRSTWRNFGI